MAGWIAKQPDQFDIAATSQRTAQLPQVADFERLHRNRRAPRVTDTARAALGCTVIGPDPGIRAAYQRTDGEGPEAEALLAEIKRRGLDV